MLKIDLKNLIIKDKFFSKKNENSITLNITGDWCPMINGNDNLMIKKKEQYYGDLLGYFKKADLNITNLETSIDTKERKLNKNPKLRLINKPQVLKSLKSINMHLACLANNHIMDNGKVGLRNTINYLKTYKIDHVGAGLSKDKIYKPYLFNKKNQKIAVINVAEGELANEKYNDHTGAADMESYQVIDQIRIFKNRGYFILLVVHAGIEFLPVPAPYIKSIYKNYVDEGADIVIGHHPHVPQGFEIYKNTPIFYSLGNFTMWRKNLRKNCYHSFFLNVKIKNNNLHSINLIPFQINKNCLNLISKSQYYKKIIELNKFIVRSNLIWKEFLNRKMTLSQHVLDALTFFYNFEKYKYIYTNKYRILSNQFMNIDYLKNKYKNTSNFDYILNSWQIQKRKDFLYPLKNIFYIFYMIIIFVTKTLKNIKRTIFK